MCSATFSAASDMADILNFYIDDSGTRKPNRAPLPFSPAQREHFALGGVMVAEADEAIVREHYKRFHDRWKLTYPLHSVDMRHAANNFGWLRRDSAEYEPFMSDLTRFLTGIPVIALACVIDRPGYDARYRERYGRNQWDLCRTAFSIVVERAAKFAMSSSQRLRVMPEKCSKKDDQRLAMYYQQLRTTAAPFDLVNSAVYSPLGSAQLRSTLYELRFKSKKSPLAQIADLFLWPLVVAGYRRGYRPYEALRAAGKLVESHAGAVAAPQGGSKYSCFELVDHWRAQKRQRPER